MPGAHKQQQEREVALGGPRVRPDVGRRPLNQLKCGEKLPRRRAKTSSKKN